MPVLNSEGDWSLSQLVAIHGLTSAQDKTFAIKGISVDLGISVEETIKVLIAEGYLAKDWKSA